MKKTILILSFVLLLVCCKTKKPLIQKQENHKTIITTQTIRDTIIETEIDSSHYQALLDCQDGKVVVKNVVNSEPGRNLKSPKVRIDNNNLNVDCQTIANKLFIQWKEKFVKEYESQTKEVPITVNQLTWLQETQIKLFWLLLIINAAYFTIKYLISKF